MKNYSSVKCILLMIVLVVSAGCQGGEEITPTLTNTLEPPTPTATATNAFAYFSNDGIELGANLNCPDRAAFGTIDENVPTGGPLVTFPIHFRWYYYPPDGTPNDWSTVCLPTSFTLYISPDPDYTTVQAIPVAPSSVDNLVNMLMYHFYLGNVTQPHTSYRWMVVGHADGVDIDDEQLALFPDEAAWKVINNNLQMSGTFQTGPVCDPQTISPVVLVNPPDEAALENDTPFFQWDMPICTSMAYRITFSTDPQMNPIYRGWISGREEFSMFAEILDPCVIYYWQVQAGLFSMDYHMQNGGWSTASDIRSLIIRSAACPNVDAVPTAAPTPTLVPTAIPTNTAIPPTAVPPPPPTAVPINCSSYNNDGPSCVEHSDVCTWVPILVAPGAGTCSNN